MVANRERSGKTAEDISALADGELTGGAAHAVLDQLLADADARERWLLYHAQADALRFPAASNLDDRAFLARFGQRLDVEPAPIAQERRPRRGAAHAPLRAWQQVWMRFGMPGAAMAAAVAVVGWMTYPYLRGVPPAPASVAATEPTPPVVLARGPSQDYFLAHQQFAPSSRMYGVVPYVRTAGTPAAAVKVSQGAVRP